MFYVKNVRKETENHLPTAFRKENDMAAYPLLL